VITSKQPAARNSTHIGRRRWLICALLFAATTINYMDRQVLGLLAPLLQVQIGWNEVQYGYIGTSFLIAYALGLLIMGPLIAHALVNSALGFGIVRFALGFGESGNFPSAIKTVAEWFPRKERALATGIFNSGTNAGATIAPLVVPWMAWRFGWRSAFLLTGIFSAIWIACWLTIYRSPKDDPKLSPAELGYILSDPAEPAARLAWSHLITHRQTWAFMAGKFLTDPVWWFFLFWLPKFFSSVHGVSLLGLGLPLVVIYNAATVGSVFGGWLAGRFLKAGWTVNRARKSAMLVCALCVIPVLSAVAAHQGWSANLFTLASDLFPKSAVASVVGIGTFAGAIGGTLIATATGWLLQKTHSYVNIFAIAAFAYLFALLVIQLLSPRLERIAHD
jgi:ACS family hexuronate transporter-like MFS transporter